MNTTKITGLIASVLMAVSLSTASYAQPHHMAPRYHSAPAYHHPAPPPRHAPYHHRYHYHNDVAGALFAGALILGTAALVGNAINNSQVVTTTPAETNTENITSENTRFWCESEKGYYPDVRACPSGWKTIPIK